MLKIIGWNACSLRNKLALLHVFIDIQKPDILFVFEPWFDKRFSSFNHPGFISYCFPNANDHSGILILVRDSIHHGLRAFPLNYNDNRFSCSSMFRCLEIRSTSLKSTILVGGFYSAPNAKKKDLLLLLESLSALCNSDLPFFLVSDANAHHPYWGSSSTSFSGSTLYNFIISKSLSVLNSIFSFGTPTHSDSSIIDLAITNNISFISSFSILPLESLSSDHCPIVISLSTLPSTTSSSVDHGRWALESADWTCYRSCLSLYLKSWFSTYERRLSHIHLGSVPYDSIDSHFALSTLSEAWSQLLSIIIQAAKCSVPKKHLRPFSKHWWSRDGVQTAYREFSRARCQYRRRKYSDSCYLRYLNARRSWRRVVKEAKQADIDEIARHLCADPSNKLLFSFLRSRDKPKNNPLSSVTSPSGTIPSSNLEAINNLAEYFCNLYTCPSAANHCPATSRAVSSVVDSDFARLSICPALDDVFSIEDISSICLALKSNSATDLHDVSPLFLKNAHPLLFNALSLLFNFSWITGSVCLDWKSAHGFPLYKGKGKDPSIPDSYRLISLTSIVARVFERLIFKRLYTYLDSTSFFSSFQFGFRRNRSTYDAIFLLQYFIHASFHNHSVLPVAFLDIKKAFDSVWHDGLLYKLFSAGVRGRCWRWISSFLRGRRFRLISSGCNSDWKSMSASVPQGSVLAALLFLIFINDLPAVCTNCIVSLFADDGAVWPIQSGTAGFSVLSSALLGLSRWSYQWRLHFSDKSSVVVFSPPRSRSTSFPSLVLESFVLPFSDSYPYLGIIFHHHMKWNDHFIHVSNGLSRSSFAICKLIHSTRSPNASTILSLVRSILFGRIAYGLPFWTPTSLQLQSIQSILVRPLRSVLGLHRHCSHLSIFVEFGLPSLSIYRSFLQCKAAIRFLSLPTPNPIATIFPLSLARLSTPDPSTVTLFYSASIASFFANNNYNFSRSSSNLFSFTSHSSTASLLESAIQLHSPIPWLSQLESFARLNSSSIPISSRLSLSSSLATSLTYTSWSSSSLGSHLKQFIKTPVLSVSHSYLALDSRPSQVLRARLRFNAARLNASLHRRNLATSPNCSHCWNNLHLPVAETVEHLLLNCPAYSDARSALLADLCSLSIYLPLSLSLILDPLSQPHSSPDSILRLTARFLTDIMNIRHF